VSEALTEFVHDALDAIDSPSGELARNSGVWRSELTPTAARFLGRPHENLLFTFDLSRWEEGSKLECLTPTSPLVQRLRSYALAKGAVTMAHLPARSGCHHPYLMAYFSARFESDQVRTEHRWLGVHLPTGVLMKVKRDPLTSPLVEGLPPGVSEGPSPDTLINALAQLSERWNQEVSAMARAADAETSRRYRQEASEITASRQPAERDRLLARAATRLQLTVESDVLLAIVVWLPS
jgi:hypothetical protein